MTENSAEPASAVDLARGCGHAQPSTGTTDPTVTRGAVGEMGWCRVVEQLCGLGIADGDLRGVLRRVTQLACAAIPVVDAASVLVGDPADPALVATSCSLAQAADGAQHRAGAGPTFDAYRLNQDAACGDLADDPWPARAGPDPHRIPPGATVRPQDHVPIRSCRAFPLTADDAAVTGVLTLYARVPHVLGGATVATLVHPFVARAQALLRDTRMIGEVATERDQLKEALQYRSVIEQAKGMIMLGRGCDADRAFDVLVRMSNVRNAKLRHVAEQFVANGGHLQPPRRSLVRRRPARPK